jgi:hypothetical protein
VQQREVPTPGSALGGGRGGDAGFQTIYQTKFDSDIDHGLMVQQPTPSSITIANAPCQPSRRAVRVSIRQQDDYSRVANGVPRAEIGFGGRFTFQQGREYLLRWSTCLPAGYQFDSRQPEGIGQIHEGAAQGSPPWSMTLVGDRYQVQMRDGTRVQTRDIGPAATDRGHWVQWTLRYRPDATGASALTELTKDGAQVLAANGIPNAYPNDNRAYFKIGIYKWWWKERPSDVSERTAFFGDVSAGVR